jgi:hypothetical protein
MAPKKSRKLVQKTMVEKPTQDLEDLIEAIQEEEQEDFEHEEDCDIRGDHENEKEQPNTILFTPKQLEVLLKMNRPDFTELVTALKGGSSKGVGFKPAKPRSFDGIQDRKVVDAWFADMEDYIHTAKVGKHSAVELA